MSIAKAAAAAAVPEAAAAEAITSKAKRVPRSPQQRAADRLNREEDRRQEDAEYQRLRKATGFDDPEESAEEPEPEEPSGSRLSVGQAGKTPVSVESGAGFVLGFLLWVWVVLPFLDGGPSQVKKVLAAKFLNRTTGDTTNNGTYNPMWGGSA